MPEEQLYPENICISCVHHLTLTHSFKLLIESSARTLTEQFDTNTYDSASDNNDCDFDLDYKPETRNKIDTYKPKSLPKNYKVRPISTANKNVSRRHLIFKRGPDKKLLFCVECKAEFYTQMALKEHCHNNHPAKSLTGRECENCNERFEDFKDLIIHRKLHMRPFLCLTCWGGYYNENDYNSHSCQANQPRRSKESEKTLRQCDQCGKSYPQGYIKVHMMTHGTDKRYSCKYCPKKFKVANGLNSHILWNHKRTRNHKCEVCNATFISASAKSTHIRKNHLKEKKYGCESCVKRFFSKSELQRHMLTHTGVKNFHCHLCDKSYQTRYGLNVHLKSHSHNVSINVLNL